MLISNERFRLLIRISPLAFPIGCAPCPHHQKSHPEFQGTLNFRPRKMRPQISAPLVVPPHPTGVSHPQYTLLVLNEPSSIHQIFSQRCLQLQQNPIISAGDLGDHLQEPGYPTCFFTKMELSGVVLIPPLNITTATMFKSPRLLQTNYWDSLIIYSLLHDTENILLWYRMLHCSGPQRCCRTSLSCISLCYQ